MFLALALITAAYVWAGWYMTWSSRHGKLPLREKLVALLALNGDEKVLDAGCGLDFFRLRSPKRLKTGKLTGVDVWNPQVLSGNSAEGALANARREGVADRIRFEDGDIRKFGFPASNFDVAAIRPPRCVFSTMNRIAEVRSYASFKSRRKARRRSSVIFDTAGVGPSSAYTLRQMRRLWACRLTSMGFLWCRLTKAVTARK